MVHPSSLRIPRVRRYSGYCSLSWSFVYVALTPFGSLSQVIRLRYRIDIAVLTPKVLLPLVWPLPLSLATTRGISFDFSSSPYLDVSVQGVPRAYLLIQYTLHDSSSWVFPHSEICGSKLICSSPQLIAACHVLRRLRKPRHPSCALLSFPFFFSPFLNWFVLSRTCLGPPDIQVLPQMLVSFCKLLLLFLLDLLVYSVYLLLVFCLTRLSSC